MKVTIKSLAPALVCVLAVIPLSNASAINSIDGTKLVVKTSIEEVNGVREIEAGQYQKGIRKTQAALGKATTASLRKPLLDNLCVAHLAIGDLEQAKQVCNEAVNTGRLTVISLNNRAVMHYMNDDLEASVADLEMAKELGSFARLVEGNRVLVNQNEMLTKN